MLHTYLKKKGGKSERKGEAKRRKRGPVQFQRRQACEDRCKAVGCSWPGVRLAPVSEQLVQSTALQGEGARLRQRIQAPGVQLLALPPMGWLTSYTGLSLSPTVFPDGKQGHNLRKPYTPSECPLR